MPSAALARGFFFEARLARARAELGLDLVKRDAADVEHDKKVIEHVGGLPDHAALILADRGNRRLDGLLAELFGAMEDAAVEQSAGVRNIRTLPRAVLHALFQVMEGKIGHASSLASSHQSGERGIIALRRVFARSFLESSPSWN